MLFFRLVFITANHYLRNGAGRMTKPTPPNTDRPPIKFIGCEPSKADFFFWLRIAIVALIFASLMAYAYGVGK